MNHRKTLECRRAWAGQTDVTICPPIAFSHVLPFVGTRSRRYFNIIQRGGSLPGCRKSWYSRPYI